MTALLQQFGMKVESTYGTPVTVDRFYELSGESLRMDIGRTRSAGLRSGQTFDRTDRFLPFKTGVSGGISLDLPNKSAGVLLNAICGGTASLGSVIDGTYIQTHVAGSALTAKFYTLQVNRPDNGATDRVFTYHGCMVSEAVFACDVDGVLTCEVTWIGEDLTTDVALASVSYASATEVFSFVDGSMTIAAAATPVRDWRLTIRNPLATRRFVAGSALTSKPLRNDKTEVEVEWTCEFDALTNYNRYVSATSAGALASVVATFNGATVVGGGTTKPYFIATTPNLDFMEVDGPNLDRNEIITTRFRGKALYDGSSEACTITYRSSDAAI